MKKIIACMLACISVMSFVGCSSDNSTTNNDTTQNETNNSSQENNDNANPENNDNLVSNGTLIVGTEAKYAPYEFVILDENGQEVFAGFDMDIAREIAKDLKMDLQIVDLPFDSLMLELQAGNIDMAIAGLSPKAERAEVADFSINYYDGEHAIVVLADELSSFTDEFSFEGLQVAGQNGSIQADYINEKMTGARFVGYSDVPTMINELKTGNVRGAVIEAPVINALLDSHTDLAILKTYVDENSQGNVVCLSKGSTEMLEKVNETIQRLIDDGSIDRFVAEAFELMDQEIG